MFALLVVPLVSTVGLAVDFGRVYFVRSQTQSALDAAALAAGRVAQVETTDKMNKASAAASAFFSQAASTDVVASTLQFSPNSEQTSFTLSAKSWVRTPFLGALNSWFQRPSLSGAPAQCEGNLYGCVMMNTTATSELKTGSATSR